MQNALMDIMKDTTKQVHLLADKFISEWYDDYEPKVYKRTYQLMHSCIATDVQRRGNTFKSAVYLDTSKMHHDITGGYTELDIVKNADKGLHGVNYARNGKTGIKLWQPLEDSVNNKHEMLESFKKYLIDNGFSDVKII